MKLRQELINLQQELLTDLEREIARTIKKPTHEYAHYSREYEEEIDGFRFRSTRHCSSLEELAREVWSRRVTTVGDYHSSPAAKETIAELLRRKDPSQHAVLALEFIHIEHQKKLDAYLAGRLTDDAFLRAIDHENTWGFDPQPYLAVIRLAREKDMEVVGINSEGSLLERDTQTVAVLTTILAEDPSSSVLVLDGDLHVAKSHLKKALDDYLQSEGRLKHKQSHDRSPHLTNRTLVVRHNDPELYWQMMQRGRSGDHLLRLERDVYAVLNENPLSIRNSYLNWLNEEEEADTRRSLSDTVTEIVGRIAQFFGIAVDLDKMPDVFGVEDIDFMDALVKAGYRDEERDVIKSFLKDGRSLFLPRGNMIYIANMALSHLSEEASHALNDICAPITLPEGMESREEFYYRIMKEAVGFVGSLIICNDRRAPQVADLFEHHDGESCEKSESNEQLLRGLVSQYHLDQNYLQTQQLNGYGSVIPSLDRYHSIALAEIVGHQLGEQLFAALIEGAVSRDELRQLFSHPFEGSSARRTYYAFMRRLEEAGFSRNHSLRQAIDAA